jgi:4-hydroxyphenylpyruvate dioxygenase-like putative hemolysin
MKPSCVCVPGEGFTFLNIPRTYYGLLEKV